MTTSLEYQLEQVSEVVLERIGLMELRGYVVNLGQPGAVLVRQLRGPPREK